MALEGRLTVADSNERSPERVQIPAWLVSWPSIILFTLLLCGSGLILLWLRPTTSTKVKASLTAVVIALVATVGVSVAGSQTPASNDEVVAGSAVDTSSSPPVQSPLPEWADPRPADSKYSGSSSAIIATVTAYGDPDSYTNKENFEWIQLDWVNQYVEDEEVVSEPESGAFKLAMVMPFDPASCGAADPDALRKAREALEDALPIGSRVLAVPAGISALNKERFFHRLSGPGNVPEPLPPAGSVSEELVATGTWVPDSQHYFDDRPFDVESVSIYGPDFKAPTPITAYDLSAPYFEDGDYAREYSDRILSAANTALNTTLIGQACQDSYTAFVKREVKESKEQDRETEAWLKKMEEDRKRGGGCRDGDGDGICYER